MYKVCIYIYIFISCIYIYICTYVYIHEVYVDLCMIQNWSCLISTAGWRPDAGLPADRCRASRCHPGKPQAAVVARDQKGRDFGWFNHENNMFNMV